MPINRRQIAQIKSVGAPVGGLNARESYAEMPPTDAIVMDNFFPTPSFVNVRNGTLLQTSGLPGPVNTLAAYTPASAARQLFAVSGSNVYDVTLQGAPRAPVFTGSTNDWWQHVNFGAGGGQYLVMVNGTNNLLLYSGTAWQSVTATSTPISITGVDTSTLISVNNFQGRLYFIQKNTMKVWFLPALSIGGAATMLDLSSQTLLGGYLVAMATWTLETTSGLVQMACFITSEGEVLTYQGNDPTYASSWYQVGSFRIGRPVGYRCYVKIGSDVAVITADGLIPLSKALLTDRSQRSVAISDKIINLINNDVQAYSQFPGWQPILYPIGNKVIVNVPAPSGTYQYVMNTLHNAWCRFTNLPAICWETIGDQLYFGAAGAVYQADIGNTDSGLDINCVVVQAPNDFGNELQKQFTMARPVLTSNGPITPAFQMNVDFNTSTPTNVESIVMPAFTYWPFPWPSPWSAVNTIYRNWLSVGAIGYVGSISMAFAVQGATVSWQATDVAFTVGGPW